MQATTTAKPGGIADRRVLILALVLGAIAAGLIVAYLASRDSGTKTVTVATTQVVVAGQDIPAGAAIESSMVALKALPETAVLKDAATSLDQVTGETARYPIPKGEQVTSARLVAPAKGKIISFQIPKGMRGFTIPVSVSNSPAALLAPGDFVDVITVAGQGTLQVGAAAPAPGVTSNNDLRSAVTLLQNVQVLSVQKDYVDNGVPYDASVRGDPPADKSIGYVMLAVTPDQAQLLWLASQEGKVTLTLRAFGDDAIATLAPISEPVRIK